jgi:hypothetical protein
VDACSGCAGDYENPDMTAPDREAKNDDDPDVGEESGGAEAFKGHVENR